MQFNCVCMQQLESRTLLSSGLHDTHYYPAFAGWVMSTTSAQFIRPQLDGKMIHYAHLRSVMDNTAQEFNQIWRADSLGMLDHKFGSKGLISLGAADVDDLKIAPDGKVVALMQTNGNSIELRRFKSDGKTDKTFGQNGTATLSLPSKTLFDAMAIQNDGKIVVTGNDDLNGYIRRFNNDGTPDTSFGKSGVVTIGPKYDHGLGWVFMGDVDIRRSDNRIVVTATDNVHGGTTLWEVFILAPNGNQEWSTEGPPMPNDNSSAGGVLVDGDNSILVSGTAELTNNDGSDSDHSILVRYPPPKSKANESWIDLGDNGPGTMLPQPDGRLLIQDGSFIRRLNHNLTTDTSFRSAGKVTIDLAGFTMAMGGDGKIVVDGAMNRPGAATDPNGNFLSLRLLGDNSLATSSGKMLRISGTSGADRISVARSAGLITVKINGLPPYLFSSSKIKRLSIDAGGGDDIITLSKTAPLATINGGDGNDTLNHKRKKDRAISIEH